jgi:hypothetical protein
LKNKCFKDNEPRKAKNVVEWEKEEWLNKSMMETI